MVRSVRIANMREETPIGLSASRGRGRAKHVRFVVGQWKKPQGFRGPSRRFQSY